MTRLLFPLMTLALLGACSSGSLHDESAAARAADAAAARALAETAPAEAHALPAWLNAERSRIGAAREGAEQRFAEAERACWRRFVVNACVRDARIARRAELDRLRQEELAVNMVERNRQAESRLRQLKQKQGPKP